MKRLLLLLSFFILTNIVKAQTMQRDTFRTDYVHNPTNPTALINILDTIRPKDTVSLDEVNFHTAWSLNFKYAVKVTWTLKASDLNCANPLARSNKFTPDPQLQKESNINSDYIGSGYDRGHNKDASDDKCAIPTVNAHCWHFTNMTPQAKKLNEITWRFLEDQCRAWALAGDDLIISCGSFGHFSEFGKDHVVVPSYCWKVVWHKDGHVNAYIFPNISSCISHPFTDYEVSLAVVEKASGLKL